LHPPQAVATVSPKIGAAAQKAGSVSGLVGWAAEAVCKSTLIVANTMRPISNLCAKLLSRSSSRAATCISRRQQPDEQAAKQDKLTWNVVITCSKWSFEQVVVEQLEILQL